jgi:hypothetical protein
VILSENGMILESVCDFVRKWGELVGKSGGFLVRDWGEMGGKSGGFWGKVAVFWCGNGGFLVRKWRILGRECGKMADFWVRAWKNGRFLGASVEKMKSLLCIIMLPVELLHIIAGVDMESYCAMLALPPFARSLDPGIITDFMISFGFGIEITNSCITWKCNKVTHRNGGPAVIYPNGEQHWYRHGEIHRDDGPAVIYSDGEQHWYRHGNIHRDDGPAVIYITGGKLWYQHGQFHRDGGPAVIYPNGTQRWYRHGKIHRDGGPAEIYSNGAQQWYQHGIRVQPRDQFIIRRIMVELLCIIIDMVWSYIGRR